VRIKKDPSRVFTARGLSKHKPNRLREIRRMPKRPDLLPLVTVSVDEEWRYKWTSPRTISTAQLKRSRALHLRPINLVVYQGPYPVNPVGNLILELASRLDAFSGYPNRTWLPGAATGVTTGTLAVRSTRSSRTRVNPPQVSYAHGG
jgi:hypothetical protein